LSVFTTDQSHGGDVAAIRPRGQLYQVRTRLADHPDFE